MRDKLLSPDEKLTLEANRISIEEVFQLVKDNNEFAVEVIAVEETLNLIDTAETILFSIDNGVSTEDAIIGKLEMGCSVLGIAFEGTGIVPHDGSSTPESNEIKTGIVKRIIEGIKILYKKAVVMIKKILIKVFGVLNMNANRFLNILMLITDNQKQYNSAKEFTVSESEQKKLINSQPGLLFPLLGSKGVNKDALDRIVSFQNDDDYSMTNKDIIIEIKKVIVDFLTGVKGTASKNDAGVMLDDLSKILYKYKTKNKIYAFFNKLIKTDEFKGDAAEDLCIMTRVLSKSYKGLYIAIPSKDSIKGDSLNKTDINNLLKSIVIKPMEFKDFDKKDKVKFSSLSHDDMESIKYFGMDVKELLVIDEKGRSKWVENSKKEQKKFMDSVLKSMDEVGGFVKELEKLSLDEDLKTALKPLFSYLNIFTTTVSLDTIVGYVDIDKAYLRVITAYIKSTISIPDEKKEEKK